MKIYLEANMNYFMLWEAIGTIMNHSNAVSERRNFDHERTEDQYA